MKSKKILSAISLLLGASLLSSCTGVTNVVTFGDYWKTKSESGSSINEELTYSVSFESDSGLTDAYSVSYSDGVYTTKLSTVTENDKTYYLYQTDLTIKVTYEYQGETKTFDDEVSSTVKFARAAEHLQPLSSYKEFVSHSPVNGDPKNVDACYSYYDYSIDVTYESDLSKGKAVVTNRAAENPQPSENEFEINDNKVRYIDNEQLLAALRCVNPSGFSAPNFLVYEPFKKAVQTVKASFDASAEGLEIAFTRNGVPVSQAINCRKATLSLNAANSGASQTLWIAELVNANANTYRNLILKMEVPVSYNLGKLVYTLKTETYTES